MRSRNYPEIEHEIEVVMKDNQLVITTPDGREIACVYVETMEGPPIPGNQKIPTKNFWVRFVPTMKCWMDDSAEVIVEADIDSLSPIIPFVANPNNYNNGDMVITGLNTGKIEEE